MHASKSTRRPAATCLYAMLIVAALGGCRAQTQRATVERHAHAPADSVTIAPARIGGAGEPTPGREATGGRLALDYRRSRRLDDDGTIRSDALQRAWREMQAVPELHADALDGGEGGIADGGIWSWEYLGPGNVGGRVRSIVFLDDDSLLIGSVSGGVWRSDDAGFSWTPVNDFLPSLAIGCMIQDPTDPDVIYAGTGEGHWWNGLPGAGLFRSEDRGVTWALVPGTELIVPGPGDGFAFIQRVAVSPTNGNVILMATKTGIWRSADRGETFDQMTTDNCSDVKFHPTSGSRAIAGRWNGDILYSSDGGLTWSTSAFSGTLFSTTVRVATSADGNADDDTLHVFDTGGCVAGDSIRVGSGGNAETVSVAEVVDADTLKVSDLANSHAKNEAAALLRGGRVEVTWGIGTTAWASMDAGGGAIWRSTDYGASFTIRNNTKSTPDYLGTQGGYDNIIWAAPDDANLVVVGGIELWRSADAGVTITQISDRTEYLSGVSIHPDHHMIVEIPSYGPGNRRVYFGCDGGVYMTPDIYTVSLTSGWGNLNRGLGITQFYAGATEPTGTFMLGGTQDNSSPRYWAEEGADAWHIAFRGDGGWAAINHENPAIQYAEIQYLAIKKSTNFGQTFTDCSEGFGLGDAGDKTRADFIPPFSMDPNNPNRLIAGGSSIWLTVDAASSWFSIRPPVSGDPFCSAIDIAKGHSNTIWVGYKDGRISRTDGGSVFSWVDVDANGPLPNRVVTDIAINPQDPDQVFVTLGGYQYDTVWFTDDAGATWQQRTGSGENTLPAIHVGSIRFHPLNDNLIYIGTDLGVLVSEDKGLNWNRTPRFGNVDNDGPVNVEVSELFWQGDETLVAATFGRGMYRTRTRGAVYIDKANNGAEDGTQPNPFNTVSEGISAAGHGTLLSIESADYDESGTTRFFKRGRVVATGGAVRIH
ncbi:MAG: hypothetical protein CHACPFDD_03541 [Phycisphaerae bacterium]|nr:hypothetical protein [Phycisphaerae bacterium]